MMMWQHHRHCEILCTLSRSFSSLLHDIFLANGQRNIYTSVWGLIPLLPHMLLSCPLTCSTLRRVHGRGRCKLPNGSASDFLCSGLVSQYCTSFVFSPILLGAYQTPKEPNQLNRAVSSSLVPFSSIP